VIGVGHYISSRCISHLPQDHPFNAMDEEYRHVAQEICQINDKFQLVWVRVLEYKFG
jgi:hypothetical protein